MEVFDDIIKKPHLEKQDLELIIDRIFVYEDHVEIKLTEYFMQSFQFYPHA